MKDSVLDQMLNACAAAYTSHTAPLIFLDTYDLQLVEEVALLGHETDRLVPLLLPSLQSTDRLAPYYDYLGTVPGQLDRCINLSYSFDMLDDFPTDRNGAPPADSAGKPILQPFLFILSVDESTDRKDLKVLQRYAARRIHDHDPQSILQRSCVLLYGDVTQLPEDLLIHTEIVEEPYPTTGEIHQLLLEQMAQQGLQFEVEATGERIARDMAGFRLMQARRVIQRLLLPDHGSATPRLFSEERRTQIIRTQKQSLLLQTGAILELVPTGGPHTYQNQLCGMERYQAWVNDHTSQMADPRAYMLDRGTPPLKGLLMCGVPGCGKSEAARMLASVWDLPLVKLNMDRLMGGLVGESERNLRTALAQAESMAPAILWMDEVDKALSGASTANKTDTTFQRMFGRLLQWMQSNDRGCFVFATANDLSCLPPEFLRKGRFDSLWAVYLPTESVCIKIFKEQMNRAEQLRITEAKAQGKPLPGPLFSRDELSNCFSTDTMNRIMACFGKNRFLTPSDICTLVTEALNSLSPEELHPLISADTWEKALSSIAESFITDAGSPDSLNKIAACYIRLLRGPFNPTAGDEDLLFLPEHYQVSFHGSGKDDLPVTAYYDGSVFASDSRYDRELFETLSTIINHHAPAYEAQLQRQSFSTGLGV